tara:strand:+ start:350 stop:589 length:240 start_codon:yes stop_codon:yes gene_type:complete
MWGIGRRSPFYLDETPISVSASFAIRLYRIAVFFEDIRTKNGLYGLKKATIYENFRFTQNNQFVTGIHLIYLWMFRCRR